MPQETVLFSATILANIQADHPAAPLTRVVQAAKLAGIHEAIEQLPNGYQVEVRERGEGLSGGKKQQGRRRVATCPRATRDGRHSMSHIRFAAPADIPALVELGRSVHAQSRFRHIPYLADRVSAALRSAMDDGKGRYAVRLIRAFEQWCANRGVAELCFGVNSVDSDAELARLGRFAARLGYRRVGEMHVKTGIEPKRERRSQ